MSEVGGQLSCLDPEIDVCLLEVCSDDENLAGREGGREGGRERRRNLVGREGGREGGRGGGREGVSEGGREGRKEGRREVVSGGRGLSMEGPLYFWSITRGGLWWEGSLNGGTTVLLVYN